MSKVIPNSFLLASATLVLAACGGGSGGQITSVPPPVPSPSPTPTPTPSPTPTPPAFQPVAATILPEPLSNPNLVVVGKGWQHDYVPNTAGSSNLRDADSFSITYDQASKTYQVTVPVAGSGTLMRTGNYGTFPFDSASGHGGTTASPPLPGFPAEPSNRNPTDYCCESLSVSAADQPQSPYRHVSFVDFYAPGPAGSNTIAYGTFAFGQPTKPGEVPLTGTARYSGDVFGHFAGDAGATWLDGKARFDFDFASALLSGDLRLGVRCMMGCTYDEITYQFANTDFARGRTTFAGQLATPGAPSLGTFSGLFAGPGAAELMAQFRLPFFNPEYQRWMDAGGAVAAKRD